MTPNVPTSFRINPWQRVLAAAVGYGVKYLRPRRGLGLGKFLHVIVRLAGDAPFQKARLNEDSSFLFPFGDYYWTRYILHPDEPYEPEIRWLLQKAADKPYVLVDCGANFGYWSILATSKEYGAHQSVAIEAGLSNYGILVANLHLNGDRFTALHRAIAGVSGETMTLYGDAGHAALTLRRDLLPEEPCASQSVVTITVDEARAMLPSTGYPPLVKLDVEGVEIEAMRGASQTIAEGALLAYEDHGQDREHAISRFVLSLPDMEVWGFDQDKKLVRIAALVQLDAIKIEIHRGYNFFAFRSGSPWGELFH